MSHNTTTIMIIQSLFCKGGMRLMTKDNIWILTEERPKNHVIQKILELYAADFNDTIKTEGLSIVPIIQSGKFAFTYEVKNVSAVKAAKVFLKTVSGSSSFFDFLLFRQPNAPVEGSTTELPLMAIEETKTGDDESRNTGVSQRGSKFVFIDEFYPKTKTYMLYNEEHARDDNKKPSDTSIFGTNILLTLGATIVGKDTTKWFKPFKDIDELIKFKSKMRKPPAGNVPIAITKFADYIEISGRLSKPADAGNIGHDPNIGGLSMISKCLRILGWNKEIIITHHGVSQDYVDKTKGKNKFLYICKQLNMRLDEIDMPSSTSLPEQYWHYEKSSEKVASILLHMVCSKYGMSCVYENHAGCERGYFWTKERKEITLPKKDKHGDNLLLPDVVLYDENTKQILLVEGKKLSTLKEGLKEIKGYDSIEKDYINKYYPGCNVMRCVSIFGGTKTDHLHSNVLIYVNQSGKVFINPSAPSCVKNAFRKVGISL